MGRILDDTGTLYRATSPCRIDGRVQEQKGNRRMELNVAACNLHCFYVPSSQENGFTF